MDSMRHLPLPCALLDPVSRKVGFGNAAFERLIQRHALAHGLHPVNDDRQALNALEQCMAQAQPASVDLPLLGHSLQFAPLYSAGNLVAVQCHAQQLRPAPTGERTPRLQRKMMKFINNTPAHIWLSRPDGQVFWMNDPLKRYLYGTLELGRMDQDRWLTSIHPDDINRTNGWFLDFLVNGAESGVDFRLRGSDGEYCWFYTTAHIVHAESGQALYVVGITVNIDDFKHRERQQAQALADIRQEHQSDLHKMAQMQQELVMVQKRELVEQLASGVSHDLNNLLFIMNLNSTMLKKRVQDEQALLHLDSIHKTIKKASHLAAQMVSFSARKPQAAAVMHPQTMMSDIESLMRNAVGPDVQLSIVYGDELGCVKVDRGYFENALINLALNGRDAMELKGELQICFFNHHAAFDGPARDFVAVEVSDNGSGMSEAVKARIFEPFYTTKPVGRGTGLGMPMVLGFVRQSDGHIEVHSELGQGTCIRLYLPRCDREEEAETPQEQAVQNKGESLLILEDDTFVRDTLAHALYDLGYKVSTAHSTDVAIKYLHTGLKVDLIVSDIRLSGDYGPANLLDALMDRGLQIPVLFTTSHAPNELPMGALQNHPHPVLFRPFSINELGLRIQQILHSRTPVPH